MASLTQVGLTQVSLTQVRLTGIGGCVALRLNDLLPLPFEVNLRPVSLATTVFGRIIALPALQMRLYLALVTLLAAVGLKIILPTIHQRRRFAGTAGPATA